MLYCADSFEWLAAQPDASIQACVTDPPYGVSEYTEEEQAKLRAGKGGVWRIPPSFDGHQRAPLPRFTVMTEQDRKELYAFFKRLGLLLARVMVPGGNIVVASEGVVLDPFAGSGSTLAAANLLGYRSIGVESDPKYVKIAVRAIPKLSIADLVDPVRPDL